MARALEGGCKQYAPTKLGGGAQTEKIPIYLLVY